MQIESVTNKQLEILTLLYRYRFLTSTHLQKFLHHKNHSLIGRYLKDLTKRQIINRIYSTTRENINSPAIYYLANKARPILNENYPDCNPNILNRIYREKQRSESFIARSLFIADLHFHFQNAAKQQNITCSFYTATDLSDVTYSPLPLPDTYLITIEGKTTTSYFLEYFEERLPIYAIKAKTRRYFTYYKADYWQDHNKEPFPTILFIFSRPFAKKTLLRFIGKTQDQEETDISFFLGLKADIQKRGIQADTWEAA